MSNINNQMKNAKEAALSPLGIYVQQTKLHRPTLPQRKCTIWFLFITLHSCQVRWGLLCSRRELRQP
jgi:hypothetical protein